MKCKFNFTISGFVISLIVIAMCVTGMGLFLVEVQDVYNPQGNSSIAEFDSTKSLINNTEAIRDATDISQKEGWIDIVGAYFSSGYSALKTSIASFDLFGDILNTAAGEIEFIKQFQIDTYIYMMVLIGVFIGVIIAALVKYKV